MIVPPFNIGSTDEYPLLAGGSVQIPAALDRLAMIDVEVPILGNLIPSVGVVDPDNVTSFEANLNNNNLTDLHYNNQSTGSANKALGALDLGSIQTIGAVALYWWSISYYAVNLRIQVSNTGSAGSFTDVTPSVTGVWQGQSTIPQVVTFTPVNARYIRMFCVTGVNATFVVLSEMRAYEPGSIRRECIYFRDDFNVIEDVATGYSEVLSDASFDTVLRATLLR